MNENENVAMQLATTRKFGELEIQVYENPQVGHSRVQDDFWIPANRSVLRWNTANQTRLFEPFIAATTTVLTRFQLASN